LSGIRPSTERPSERERTPILAILATPRLVRRWLVTERREPGDRL